MTGRGPAGAGALLSVAAFLVAAAPAGASYGGAPVPAAAARPLAWFTMTSGAVTSECSGVLVTRRHVLTAAHCVRAAGARLVPAGPLRLGGPRGPRFAITRIAVHPRHRRAATHGAFDLAVLTLDRRAAAGPLRVASAAEDASVRPPGRAVAAGFGVRRAGQGLGPRPARAVRLEVLAPLRCVTQAEAARFSATSLCAAHPRAGICAGDSGGPLLVRRAGRRVVVGITSRTLVGAPCRRTVAVFARVAPARAWVTRATGGALPR